MGDGLRSCVRSQVLHSRTVLAAFRRVERRAFIPEASRRFAFVDRPIAVKCGGGFRESILLAPSVHALALEALHLEPSHRLLCIGSGVGYLMAVAAYLVGARVASASQSPKPQL